MQHLLIAQLFWPYGLCPPEAFSDTHPPSSQSRASSAFCCSRNLHSTQDQHTLDCKDQQESGLVVTSALAHLLNERKKNQTIPQSLHALILSLQEHWATTPGRVFLQRASEQRKVLQWYHKDGELSPFCLQPASFLPDHLIPFFLSSGSSQGSSTSVSSSLGSSISAAVERDGRSPILVMEVPVSSAQTKSRGQEE